MTNLPDTVSPSKNTHVMTAIKRFLSNLQRYVADGQKADILYAHQKDIFYDTAKFLEAGERRGYIDAPTGTGKTVLFVSLVEAFSYKDNNPPKILVVAPTKDLVRQTLGGTLGDKGFAGFAPDLKVGTFYSDTPSSRRALDDQVTITTYASLAKLAAMKTSVRRSDGTFATTITNKVNELYDIIILDEGHKALGYKSRQIIEELDDDKLIIGFSATPDYDHSRRLDSLLPHKIHRLDLKEAIRLNMLSSVVPLAVKAPESAAREFTIGASGEYETKSLKQLIFNGERNTAIVQLAIELIQNGHTPIIACIPGYTMTHPHRIADELSEQKIRLADGSERYVRAHAVTGAMPAASRQRLYAQLEAGEIDALAYIDVLTEGWDSQRANVIINARPTRSLVAARQRMGRVLRNKPDERPALVIDIVDKISSSTAPQVSLADIFELDELAITEPIGVVAPDHLQPTKELLQTILIEYEVLKKVFNLYTQYVSLLETLPKVTHGRAQIEQSGKVRTFATADRLFNRFEVDSLMLDHLKARGIETRQVRSRYEAIDAYDEDQLHDLIADLPDGVRPSNYMIVNDKKYLSVGDLVDVMRTKLAMPDMSYQQVEAVVRHVATHDDDLYFCRRFRARTHRNVLLYTARTMVEFSKIQAIARQLQAAE